jgi:hypothetical protein
MVPFFGQYTLWPSGVSMLGPTHTASTPRSSSFEPPYTRTHTLHPNRRARLRSGFSPVTTSYGDFGVVFFVGVRLRSQTT